jgi:predicted glycosyltransferase
MAMQEHYKGFTISRTFIENATNPECDRVSIHIDIKSRVFPNAETARQWIDNLMLQITKQGVIPNDLSE